MAPRKLIINADDFGLTQEVNDAIIDVFENGSLTSATLMVNMPGTEHAAKRAAQFPRLGVGLHYNLTEGRPVSNEKNDCLTGPDGDFFSRNMLLARLALHKVKPSDLRWELNAQFERILRLGIQPTHIDSHQHIHLHPTVFRVIREFAVEKQIAVRIPYPQTLSTGSKSFSLLKRLKKRVTSNTIRQLDFSRLVTNNSLNSVHDLIPFENLAPEHYQRLILESEGTAHELMVHVFADSENLRAVYENPKKYAGKEAFLKKCFSEYEILRRFSVRDWIQAHHPDIQLCTFRDIA
jgi:predicted glycoside hydrolase/deacetylase ChbG (UPF0249 family)